MINNYIKESGEERISIVGNNEVLSSLCSQLDIDMRLCSAIKHGKDWYEHESKRCYDIWIITDGDVKIEMDEKNYILNKGDVFLYYPQRLYSAYPLSQGCSFIFVHFNVSLGNNQRVLDSFALDGHTFACDIKEETSLFLNIYNQYKNSMPMSALALKGALLMLVSKIASVKIKNNNFLDTSMTKSPYIRLEKILSYIIKNLNNPLPIKDLADYACMSEKYFISFFKNTIGITPFAYISKLKLKRAFDYLSEGKYSVKETAQMLGYSDQYTFSKAFKRFYGFPPSNV